MKKTIVDEFGTTIKTIEVTPEGQLIYKIEQDAELLRAQAKRHRDYNEYMGINPAKKDFSKVREIPMALFVRAYYEGWWGDEARMKKELNDPANRDLRIYDGTI